MHGCTLCTCEKSTLLPEADVTPNILCHEAFPPLPSTATRQPSSTATRQPPSKASRQPSSTAARQPSTTTRQPPSTATRQPSTVTRQPPSTASRQPPSIDTWELWDKEEDYSWFFLLICNTASEEWKSEWVWGKISHFHLNGVWFTGIFSGTKRWINDVYYKQGQIIL